MNQDSGMTCVFAIATGEDDPIEAAGNSDGAKQFVCEAVELTPGMFRH